jgi:glyoxylate reductase
MLGREIHGATLGIIGMGQIGSQIARRALGFGMTILYHNRRPRPEVEQALGVRFTALDELLANADYVVLSVPLTDQTRGLIGSPELAKMKRTATLINVARGPVVQTAALTEALRSGQIASAALDVTDPHNAPSRQRNGRDPCQDGGALRGQPHGRPSQPAARARGEGVTRIQ